MSALRQVAAGGIDFIHIIDVETGPEWGTYYTSKISRDHEWGTYYTRKLSRGHTGANGV